MTPDDGFPRVPPDGKGWPPRVDGRELPRGGALADAVRSVGAAHCASLEAARHRTAILDFVASHPDALHRSCLDGHLTGSALVVNHDLERVLLLLHAKLGMWLQPGGHADGEGHLGTVAWQEAVEETGITGLQLVDRAIDCDVHVIPSRPGEPEHLHLDVRYLLFAPPDATVTGNHESHALRWATLADLDQLATDQSLRRLAAIGLAVAASL